MGTTEFLSVPYALHAKTADELIDPIWKKNGNAAYNLEDKIVVGSLNPDADGLTIKSGNYSSGELVDFRSDTLAGGADVLNMYVYNVDHATDPAQFIEMSVAGSGTMFRLNTDGTLQKTSLTGSADMLPIAYGNVNSAGVLNSGTSNVGTITKVSTGNYNVAINNETANINDYIVVLNSISNSSVNVSWTISGGSFRIYTRNVTTDLYADARFNFIIYKP